MKILIASKIHPDTVAKLRLTHDVKECINASENELCEIISDRDVLIFRSGVQINRTVLTNATNLKLLIRAGSGLDNLDLPFATELGIDLVRIPEPGAQAVAELAFAGKIKAAKDTQRDPDFCVVARVESFIAGWGLSEALRRAEIYLEAGADAILIHSKKRLQNRSLIFNQSGTIAAR